VKDTFSIPGIKNSVALAETAIPYINELNSKAFHQRHLDQHASMIMAEQAFELSVTANYQKGKAEALLNIGFQELTNGRYDKAFNLFNQSLHIFLNLKDTVGIAHVNYNLGVVYLRLGDYENALEAQQESLRLRKELKDDDGIASCKSQTAYINTQFGLNDTALQEYYECIGIWRNNGNKAGLASALMALGNLKLKLNDLGKAKGYLIESLNIRKELNEMNGWLGSTNYLSDVYLKEGNTGEALKLLGDALITALNQQNPFAAGICRLRTNLAKVYGQMNDQQNAILQLEKALDMAIETKQQYQLHDIYFELSKLYKTIGRFDKALDYHEKFHVSKENVITLNAAAKLRNLEMMNKVEMGEKEIEIHRLKNIELKERNKIIREERKKSDDLLLNILPRQIARELKKNGTTKVRQYKLATVLFTDFESFTKTAEKLSPEELVSSIDKYFRAFDEIITKNNIEKIKTIGDSYMAAGGLPEANTSNPFDVVNAGMEIMTYVKEQDDPLFKIRIGIHSGAVVAGIVGNKKFAYDIWGDTVNIASRMESSGVAGKINISRATYELVKAQFNCIYRGKVTAKNKGIIDMYFVEV